MAELNGKMKTLTFLIRQDKLLNLDIFAKENGMLRSDAIRYAISILDDKPIVSVDQFSFPIFSRIKLARVSVILPEDLISKIDRIASMAKITRSDVIRTAICRLLQNNIPKSQLQPGFICPFCDNRFASVRALRIHLARKHHGIPWCPICLKMFKNETPFDHFRRFHDPQHYFWYTILLKRKITVK